MCMVKQLCRPLLFPDTSLPALSRRGLTQQRLCLYTKGEHGFSQCPLSVLPSPKEAGYSLCLPLPGLWGVPHGHREQGCPLHPSSGPQEQPEEKGLETLGHLIGDHKEMSPSPHVTYESEHHYFLSLHHQLQMLLAPQWNHPDTLIMNRNHPEGKMHVNTYGLWAINPQDHSPLQRTSCSLTTPATTSVTRGDYAAPPAWEWAKSNAEFLLMCVTSTPL